MSLKLLIDSFNREYWEKSAANFEDYSIYQTWPYQQIRADKSSSKLNRFILFNNETNPIMMGQIRIKSFLNFKIGYIQYGPLFQNKQTVITDYQKSIDLLKNELVSRLNLNVLRFKLNILSNKSHLADYFLKCSFEFAKYYKKMKTFIVPLEKTEENLLSSLHHSARRQIRKAQKLDLEIDIRLDEEYFPSAHQMFLDLQKRKGFKGTDSAVFWQAQKELSQREKIEMIIFKYENQPVAIHATSHLGNTAVPVLTANNSKGLELNLSTYLWWLAYLQAKKRGMTYYDLRGYNEKTNPKGFFFKKKMGGEPVQFLPPLDYCRNKMSKLIWLILSKKYYFS